MTKLSDIKGLLPEKKAIEDNFVDDCYCNSCRLSETFCQCKGFNSAIDLMDKTIDRDKLVEIMKRTVMDNSTAKDYISNYMDVQINSLANQIISKMGEWIKKESNTTTNNY